MRRDQAATDRAWKTASDGFMRMEKITYRSRVGDLDIPAFVFQPLAPAAPKTRPALPLFAGIPHISCRCTRHGLRFRPPTGPASRRS